MVGVGREQNFFAVAGLGYIGVDELAGAGLKLGPGLGGQKCRSTEQRIL